MVITSITSDSGHSLLGYRASQIDGMIEESAIDEPVIKSAAACAGYTESHEFNHAAGRPGSKMKWAFGRTVVIDRHGLPSLSGRLGQFIDHGLMRYPLLKM